MAVSFVGLKDPVARSGVADVAGRPQPLSPQVMYQRLLGLYHRNPNDLRKFSSVLKKIPDLAFLEKLRDQFFSGGQKQILRNILKVCEMEIRPIFSRLLLENSEEHQRAVEYFFGLGKYDARNGQVYSIPFSFRSFRDLSRGVDYELSFSYNQETHQYQGQLYSGNYLTPFNCTTANLQDLIIKAVAFLKSVHVNEREPEVYGALFYPVVEEKDGRVSLLRAGIEIFRLPSSRETPLDQSRVERFFSVIRQKWQLPFTREEWAEQFRRVLQSCGRLDLDVSRYPLDKLIAFLESGEIWESKEGRDEFVTGKEEELLAFVLGSEEKVGPAALFAEALRLNGGKVFEAILTCHNLAFKYHATEQERRQDTEGYRVKAALTEKLVDIRGDKEAGGEHTPAWYHLFGTMLLAFYCQVDILKSEEKVSALRTVMGFTKAVNDVGNGVISAAGQVLSRENVIFGRETMDKGIELVMRMHAAMKHLLKREVVSRIALLYEEFVHMDDDPREFQVDLAGSFIGQELAFSALGRESIRITSIPYAIKFGLQGVSGLVDKIPLPESTKAKIRFALKMFLDNFELLCA